MASDLTAGYLDDCIDGVGGVAEVVIFQLNNVESFTLSVDEDEVTGITLATTTQGFKFEFDDDNPAIYTDVMTVNTANGTSHAVQTGSWNMTNQLKATRNTVRALSRRRTVHFVKYVNGDIKAYGFQEGLKVVTGDGTTGTVKDDLMGYVMNFAGDEKELSFDVSQAIYDQVLTPAP